ncbi:Endo-1,6-beta-D-glucanase [Lachnellula suecica]|uniref:Endo-1,6-beta-D-glucanase n=1 Tax=Lachnellula suecica TaxID=602035 RepID=A0A8T9C9Q4_9HELO|nr:Endo-1,6-beta-D-glucanase [Lachnellula suecica]
MNLLQLCVASMLPVVGLATPQLEKRQATKITVDLTKKYQTMDGFGVSLAFQRANLILALPTDKQRAVMDLLFSNTTGAGFTILRNGLGSSPDSSSDHMNTIEPKSPGSPTGTPVYVWDGKDSGQFSISQQAASVYGVKQFYANAWSAPGFMKSNGNDANGGTLSSSWNQAFANYLIQYIGYYLNAGVPVTYIGFLNEPDYSASYASMLSNGQQAASFIKVLRPSLDAANLTSVGIVCCESTGWSQAQSIYSGIKSSGADSMISVVSSHEYSSRASSSLSTTHHSWSSEYADLNGGWTTAWYSSGGVGEGLTWANNIYTAIVNANVSAYIAWEGVQGGSTNEKLIQINSAGNDFQVSKRLWAFAQYSRTVLPGAVRVGTSGGSFKTTAFKNVDGSIAVNVINTGTSAASVTIAITGFNATAANAWITDSTHDMPTQVAIIGTDGSVSGAIPARAMVSFLINGA